MKTNRPRSQEVAVCLSFKTNLALIVLASPALRRWMKESGLKHLYSQVFVDPRSIAFALLSRLGTFSDPEFAWYAFDVLLRVPVEVLEDPWLKGIVNTMDELPGSSFRSRIQLAQRVLAISFGLWDARKVAAGVLIDYDRVLGEVRSPDG